MYPNILFYPFTVQTKDNMVVLLEITENYGLDKFDYARQNNVELVKNLNELMNHMHKL